jgi:hypothetical protein
MRAKKGKKKVATELKCLLSNSMAELSKIGRATGPRPQDAETFTFATAKNVSNYVYNAIEVFL